MKKVYLYAPESYNVIERKKCNGCGSGWMAKRYYNAVKYYGGDAYWQGKNKDTELKEIFIRG